jgi:hypothetical protein
MRLRVVSASCGMVDETIPELSLTDSSLAVDGRRHLAACGTLLQSGSGRRLPGSALSLAQTGRVRCPSSSAPNAIDDIDGGRSLSLARHPRVIGAIGFRARPRGGFPVDRVAPDPRRITSSIGGKAFGGHCRLRYDDSLDATPPRGPGRTAEQVLCDRRRGDRPYRSGPPSYPCSRSTSAWPMSPMSRLSWQMAA